MGWLLLLLAIPGIWVAWQIIKIIVGALTPPAARARNVLLYKLKPNNIGPAQIGEATLEALSSHIGRMASLAALARQSSEAEQVFWYGDHCARMVVNAALGVPLSDTSYYDDWFVKILTESNSPLVRAADAN